MKKIIRITTVPGSLKVLLKDQLKFINKYYHVIGVSSSGQLLSEVQKAEGIDVFAIDMTRTISPLKDLKALYQLYQFLRREKPFIVHTHTPKAGTLGMLAAKLAGVPNRLHTIAGLPLLEATGLKRQLLNLVEKITYASATLVLPNSFALKDIIINSKFCNAKKLRVIGNGSSNGINTDHYDKKQVDESIQIKLRKSLDIKADDTVFIFIGRIVKDKGINELVRAFDNLCYNQSNIKLLILGEEEKNLDPIAIDTARIINQNLNIHTTGHVHDIRPYLAISDIFTFPSYREGFPNVVLQASCMELPCIVSNINGCNEIIIHDFNGLIIPVKNTESLEQGMLKLLHDKNKREELSKNARPNIIKKYKREVIWEELLELYNSFK
ncbi:glycosyltransferase family 4 protein [Paucihalobacter ruber]|uniref:Glycosyltransferase family 4 protein n=1 Tax=Paucihalobacter ruber TaxID=2567861 RepID=A0A506PIF8_9FLAO|nr:glycosyltransferase family 4 protein [Paucihalobacter ruber]TPV33364.1 glycosyltransferase family 4 protein [Paucihalobacter ruber]